MPVRFCVSTTLYFGRGDALKRVQVGHVPTDRTIAETLANELAVSVDEFIQLKEVSVERGMTFLIEVQS